MKRKWTASKQVEKLLSFSSRWRSLLNCSSCRLCATISVIWKTSCLTRIMVFWLPSMRLGCWSMRLVWNCTAEIKWFDKNSGCKSIRSCLHRLQMGSFKILWYETVRVKKLLSAVSISTSRIVGSKKENSWNPTSAIKLINWLRVRVYGSRLRIFTSMLRLSLALSRSSNWLGRYWRD